MADVLDALTSIESDRLELAQCHDKRFRELERIKTEAWSEQAELAIQIEDNKLYAELGFTSFGKWLVSAAPKSRSAMYAYMGIIRELEEVSIPDRRRMDVGTAKVIAKVPKRLRGKVVREASDLAPREAVKYIQKRHPSLHIEQDAPRQYSFTASQSEKIDGAIELAKTLFDLNSDEAAIEAIVVEFMQDHQSEYEKIKAGEII